MNFLTIWIPKLILTKFYHKQSGKVEIFLSQLCSKNFSKLVFIVKGNLDDFWSLVENECFMLSIWTNLYFEGNFQILVKEFLYDLFQL